MRSPSGCGERPTASGLLQVMQVCTICNNAGHADLEEEPPGLRERKRQRTRETIARVALELFDRQGFQETTIAQIAEAADVSPRTVSGLLPAQGGPRVPRRRGGVRRLRRRACATGSPARPRPTRCASWIRSLLRGGRAARERAPDRVGGSSTPTRACACYEHHSCARVQERLAAAIARDLGASADDLEPRMAAAATLTVFELLGRHDDDADPAEALARHRPRAAVHRRRDQRAALTNASRLAWSSSHAGQPSRCARMPGTCSSARGARDLEVDVAVEQRRSTARRSAPGPSGPSSRPTRLAIGCGHDISRAASAARSLRRASWMVL